MNYGELIEALSIFQKYDKDGASGLALGAAEHDEIWAGLADCLMSKTDENRLEELGWDYEEGCGWHKFV